MILQYHSWAYIWRKPCFKKVDTCIQIFIAALLAIIKTWKQMSIDRVMDEKDVVYILYEILCVHINLPINGILELEGILDLRKG